MFGNTANKITGSINKRYNTVQYYFELKKTNDSLLAANERLYNVLQSQNNFGDSLTRRQIDTIKLDSTVTYRTSVYYGAKVVANAVNSLNNYIVLNGPNVKKFTVDMAVVDVNNNVVGRTTEISGEYAVVMSLLHKDSKLDAKMARTGEAGTLTWTGKEPNVLQLSGIPKSAALKVGDSVVTSGFSTTFPKGLLLGRIISAQKNEAGALDVKVRAASNFTSLQFAYALFNDQKKTIDDLLNKHKTATE